MSQPAVGEVATSVVWPELMRPAHGPLAGVRVLDLSAFAVGPWAASLLAALGADVVKVDPPYGDHIRSVKPSRNGEGTTYTISNLGKRNIELDLKNPIHRGYAQRLASIADIVVENSREGAMARLQMDYETLRQINPRLIYCASSSFGSSGPMAVVGSTDPQGQAFSGFVSIQGDEGGLPEFLRYFAAIDLGTSLYLLQAVLIGLLVRARTGRGCEVKTSQMEGSLALQTTRIAEYLVAGVVPRPLGAASAAFAPSDVFRCRDSRYLAVSAPDDATWSALCLAIGRPELAADPRFTTNRQRVAHRAELTAALAERLAEADSTWWRLRLGQRRVPNAMSLSLDDSARGTGTRLVDQHFVELDHPTDGRMRAVRPPWEFSRTPAVQRPAPVPGQHSRDFVPELAGSNGNNGNDRGTGAPVVGNAGGDPADAGSARHGAHDAPLAGLRVVEVCRGLPGPYCGSLLVELGASVTKLEPPSGDPARAWAPAVGTGDGAAFAAINRGKRIVPIHETAIADDEAACAYLRDADVVLVDADAESFGVRSVDDLLGQIGLGERTVVCRLTSAGPDTAGTQIPATELELQLLSGLSRYLGNLNDAPVRVGADIVSMNAGAVALQGVLAALVERESSGRGQIVDISAMRSMLAVLSVMVAALDNPQEWGGFHCLAAAYPRDHGVMTSEGAISFSSPKRSDAEWVALCDELGAAPLGRDERYATDALRTPRSKELNHDLSRYTKQLDRATVLGATLRHGGLGVPVQNYAEVFAHPQALAMDLIDATDGHSFLAAPWRINGVRPHVGGRALNADTSGSSPDTPTDTAAGATNPGSSA
jgi:crotonobetainyl-CoA:carnitine CoA-transferase CaiB-like acyl-CoA transferase